MTEVSKSDSLQTANLAALEFAKQQPAKQAKNNTPIPVGKAPQPAAPQPAVEEEGFFDKAQRFVKDNAAEIISTGIAIFAGGKVAKSLRKAIKQPRTLNTATNLSANAQKFLKTGGKAAVVGGTTVGLASCSKDGDFLGHETDIELEHEHLVKPRIVTNTIEVPVVKRDTVYLPGETIIKTDTVYKEITLPADTILFKPDWHSEVNPEIDEIMDELGVEKEGNGEFTETFAAYDEHNNRVVKYTLNPQASAKDGTTLSYNKTITNWDEEAGTIVPGKNEEKSKVSLSLTDDKDNLHIIEDAGSNGIQSMDTEQSGNLFFIKNQRGEIGSKYEPTNLFPKGSWLEKGDFENSIKWNWETGAYGHFTNAKRKTSDAPVTE